MKIQFVEGLKYWKDNKRKFITYLNISCLGMFMDKTSMHFRYINKNRKLKRIPDSDESFIYVVIQDNPIETFKTLFHEICHLIVFKLFKNPKKLHRLIDKIDNGK